MLKKLITISLIFFSAGCVKNWYKPMGYTVFKQMPKGGTPGFELGWTHGCQSGLGSQFAGAIYMTFYTWSKDADIASTTPDINKIRVRYSKELRKVNWNDENDIKKNFSDYNTIFWGAHAFCRHAALGILQTAGMGPPLPGEERYNPGAHSVSSIWKLDGKGDVRLGTGFW